MAYKAEYIWIDGTEPTARLRSKTKILADGADLPIWGFDGSSTSQAPGENSDCVLQPVYSCPDPLRGGDHKLVMCEVMLPDMTPHASNTRARLRPVAEKYADQEPLFGIGQEYTLFENGRPHGFPPAGFPAPQGFYYCGVGSDEVYGRELVERHMDANRVLAVREICGATGYPDAPTNWAKELPDEDSRRLGFCSRRSRARPDPGASGSQSI